ncbi:MAG: DUF115 domain-containing protein [Methanomassiliicoccales archaeon]|nr:DUF115 domain-containing protein [Methanomassiliicoccales archaeon]NYT15835.1 DUF115 domain-containing protein [Methanomassiliicoccales archaeon]
MEFEEWEPIYHDILKDMGYDPVRDIEAARLLDSLCPRDRICGIECLCRRFCETATIIGHGPDLEEALERAKLEGTVISADGATSSLLDIGVIPEIIVTDLDGNIEDEIESNVQGSIAVIHAHGDNMYSVSEHLPLFPGLITPTVQCRPFGNLFNFGGFTDGDRAVMMALHFGVRRIILVGFDFENPREKEGRKSKEKIRKLVWAKKMILQGTDQVELEII